MPKSGTAAVNDFVPSIGSSTQTNSASAFSMPISSPTIPWPGNFPWIMPRISSSAPRSATVTGDRSAFSSTFTSERPKNGRMKSPLDPASSAMNARWGSRFTPSLNPRFAPKTRKIELGARRQSSENRRDALDGPTDLLRRLRGQQGLGRPRVRHRARPRGEGDRRTVAPLRPHGPLVQREDTQIHGLEEEALAGLRAVLRRVGPVRRLPGEGPARRALRRGRELAPEVGVALSPQLARTSRGARARRLSTGARGSTRRASTPSCTPAWSPAAWRRWSPPAGSRASSTPWRSPTARRDAGATTRPSTTRWRAPSSSPPFPATRAWPR